MRRLISVFLLLLLPSIALAWTVTGTQIDSSGFWTFERDGYVRSTTTSGEYVVSPGVEIELPANTVTSSSNSGDPAMWGYSWSTGVSELWIQVHFKYAANFDFHSVANKLIYIYNAAHQPVFVINGPRPGSWYMQPWVGAPFGSRLLSPNLTTTSVTAGNWYKLKIHINTSSGLFEYWVNDIKNGYYTDVNIASSLTEVNFTPVWGGTGDTGPSVTNYQWYDEAFISNDTEPGGSGGGDYTPPYASDHSPIKSSTGQDNTVRTITFHVKDNQTNDTGVDTTKITANIEGVEYTCASGLTCTGSASDITVTYTNATDWSAGQTVNITTDAADLAGNWMASDVWSFTTASSTSGEGWVLSWSDEFNRSGCTAASKCLPDNTVWNLTSEQGLHSGWSGPEEVWYDSTLIANNWEADGILTLQARYATVNGYPYTSPALITQTAFGPYGRLDVRAKMGSTVNAVNYAIWLVGEERRGDSGWPEYGEIDIAEYVPGSAWGRNKIGSTFHTVYSWKTYNSGYPSSYWNITAPYSDYHIYSMEWYPTHINILVDNVVKLTKTNNGIADDWPFSRQAFDLILNIEPGSNFGGGTYDEVDPDQFPLTMLVDYVRFYTWGTTLAVVTTETMAGGTVGTAYSASLAATGGTSPYTWDNTGVLPPGLSLSTGGVISGIPTTSGTYNFSVTATDAASASDSQDLSITISPLLPGGQTTVTWSANITDTFINSGDTDNNASSETFIEVYQWPSATVANRTLLSTADALALPDNVSVTAATLRLYLESWEGSGGTNPMRVYVYGVSGTVPIATVTWADFAGTLASATDVTEVTLTPGWFEWDITALVRAAYSADATLILALDGGSDGASDTNRIFSSVDGAYPPEIVVTYTQLTPEGIPVSAPGRFRISRAKAVVIK